MLWSIIATYIVLGALMDELAMILLTVPIFFPVVTAVGYDPIWFGVIIVVVVQIGLIAPPVGLNVFVIGGMARDVPLATIYRGILPFLAAQIVLLVLLTLWPGMALLLPSTHAVSAPASSLDPAGSPITVVDRCRHVNPPCIAFVRCMGKGRRLRLCSTGTLGWRAQPLRHWAMCPECSIYAINRLCVAPEID